MNTPAVKLMCKDWFDKTNNCNDGVKKITGKYVRKN